MQRSLSRVSEPLATGGGTAAPPWADGPVGVGPADGGDPSVAPASAWSLAPATAPPSVPRSSDPAAGVGSFGAVRGATPDPRVPARTAVVQRATPEDMVTGDAAPFPTGSATSELPTLTSRSAPSAAEPSGEVDVVRLAERVYDLLLIRLEAERERRGW